MHSISFRAGIILGCVTRVTRRLFGWYKDRDRPNSTAGETNMPSDTGASAPKTEREYDQQAQVPDERAMAIQAALGRLIELMNPYSNPGCETHNEYRMEYVNFRTLPVDAQEPNRALFAQFEVEIDNYEQDWTIRGQTYRVVRGRRI